MRSRSRGWNPFDVETTAQARTATAFVLDGEKGLVLQRRQRAQADRARRASRGGQRDTSGLGLFLVDADAAGVTRRGYPTQDGRRAAEIALAGRRARRRCSANPAAAGAVIERVDRRRDRRAVRGGGRRDGRSGRDDDRVSEDAQAVRRADRLVPGAAASRRRHGGRARTGAQHDVSGGDDGGRGATRTSAARAISRGQGADRPLRANSSASRRRNCMAASP